MTVIRSKTRPLIRTWLLKPLIIEGALPKARTVMLLRAMWVTLPADLVVISSQRLRAFLRGQKPSMSMLSKTTFLTGWFPQLWFTAIARILTRAGILEGDVFLRLKHPKPDFVSRTTTPSHGIIEHDIGKNFRAAWPLLGDVRARPPGFNSVSVIFGNGNCMCHVHMLTFHDVNGVIFIEFIIFVKMFGIANLDMVAARWD